MSGSALSARRARPRVLLGLLGAPIAHSAAPAMHEAAGDALGLRLQYRLIEIAGADAARLRALLDGVRDLGFAGINVTYPYKEAVVPLLDALASDAGSIGAVNTVVVRDGRLVGHNTDATGFRSALRETVGERPPGPVALVGAGGVGRAAAFALRDAGCTVAIYDRDADRARALAEAVGGRACGSVEAALDGAAGLVNGTPVGMLPNRDSPVPVELLHAGLWVADAVYNPLVTPLLVLARRVGARCVTGQSLAIHQALDAFALFTGREAPEAAMRAAFDAVIAARDAA